MRRFLIASFSALLFSPLAYSQQPQFSYTLFQEPTTLDPQMLSSASGNYVVTVIYRGLYKWSLKDGLSADEGECIWLNDNLSLKCTISETAKWSDGSPVKAEDYVRTFRFLIDPKNAAPMSDSLMSIKNAKDIFQKRLPIEQLGVISEGSKVFKIHFSSKDSDFLYKFLHPAFYPRHKSFVKRFKPSSKSSVSNGPFVIEKWKSEAWFDLIRNPHFQTPKTDHLISRVRALIMDSDATALQLFETQKIHLLRRLPTSEFARFKDHPGFYKLPVLRFDYIGFAPSLRSHPTLRSQLAHSFDPKQFQTLFHSDGEAGCPSIPSSWYSGKICQKLTSTLVPKKWPKDIPPVFGFSQMGGDDIQRAAEWFQNQWSQRLKLKLELQSREQKSYISWLKTDPPALFRKGVGIDRPTCLAALETFSKSNAENFIRLEDERFEKILLTLSQTLDLRRQKSLCTEGLKILIDGNHIIPLGEMYFAGLLDQRFRGVKLNELNQLDLRDLSFTP